MNAKSLAIAAVAAWVVDSIYGFLVFGMMLQSEFAKYPGVFRSFNQVNALLPLMFGATLYLRERTRRRQRAAGRAAVRDRLRDVRPLRDLDSQLRRAELRAPDRAV